MRNILVKSKRTSFFVAMCLALLGCGQDRERLIATGGGGGMEATSEGNGGRAGSHAEGRGGAAFGTSTTSSGGNSGGSSSTEYSPSTRPIYGGMTLMLDPQGQRVRQGESTVIGVAVWQKGSGGWTISLSVQGLPEGVSGTPISVGNTVRGAGIPIQVSPTAPIGGPYAFEVTASSNISLSTQGKMYIVGPLGALDTTFGGSGVISLADVLPSQRQTDAPREFVRSATVDSMGRIILGGYSSQITDQGWVLRLSQDGSLDKTFGYGGILSDFGTPASRVLGLTQLGGALYVGADRTDTSGITKGYLRTLSESALGLPSVYSGFDSPLDATPTEVSPFGGGVLITTSGVLRAYTAEGKVNEAFSSAASGSIETLVVDASNGVVYARVVDNKNFEVGRLLSSGGVDTAFGTNGLVTISCPEAKPLARSVKLLSPGGYRMLVAALVNCASGPTAGGEQSEVIALSLNGTPSTMFGQTNRTLVVSSGRSVGGAFDPNGNLAILGRHVLTTDAGVEVRMQMRLLSFSGVFDATFGNAGLLELPYIEDPVVSYDSRQQRIIVVGSAPDAGGGVLKVMRVWL